MIWKLSFKIWAIIIVVIILIVVAIYYAGKKSSYDTGYIPNDVVIPGGNALNKGDKQAVQTVTARLYKEMDGLNLSYDSKVYSDFNALSDILFVAVYNLFNKLYQGEGNGTLRDWINSESTPFWGMISSINTRFDRLNLA